MEWRTPLALAVGLFIAALLAAQGGRRLTASEISPEVAASVQAEGGEAGGEANPPPRSDLTAPPAVMPGRAVAGERIAPPPLDSAALERVEPRAPLSPFGQPLVHQRKPVTLLHRPVADAAGRVRSGDITVTIAGLDLVEAERNCTDAEGRSWPCGVRARTAFRAFLRGRALSCDLPAEMEVKQADVACRLGKVDVGEWLARSGWAEARADGPYAALGDEARREGRGIFGAAPSSQ